MNLSDCRDCGYNYDGECEYWGCPYAEVEFCTINTNREENGKDNRQFTKDS